MCKITIMSKPLCLCAGTLYSVVQASAQSIHHRVTEIADGDTESAWHSGRNKRSQRFQILHISTRIVVGRLQNERAVREFGMLRESSESVSADVAFADVPVTIDA
jgi:hypothetical protein